MSTETQENEANGRDERRISDDLSLQLHNQYAENDNQVTLYLFRGSGCSHCHDFLEFLNNNLAENGYENNSND